MTDAPGRLAGALHRAREDDAQQGFAQGVVTALPTANTVTVDLGGSSVTAPRLASYSMPLVGDVVWCFGPPGTWVVAGKLA